MLSKITMPSMGATVEEGTIVVWSLNEGDSVKVGDVLVEIESEKATFDYESPCDGVVRRILVEEGETVPVGQLMAIVGDAEEEIPADWLEPAAEEPAPSAAPVTQASPQPVDAAKPAGTQRVRISPRARKLAEKLGVDIANVTGSGPGGRIESSDIEKAAEQAGRPIEVIPFTTVRRQINRTVTRSKSEIPHFYVETVVGMTAAMAYRNGLAKKGNKISVNALMMKAIAAGIEAEPGLNMAYSESGYVPRGDTNVGLAIETPEGVVIAVIDRVDRCDLAELSEKIAECVMAARDGRFEMLKTRGACMTISNLGMYRVEGFMPIIHPGESAVLGIGSIAERPVVQDGEIMIRQTMPVTICVDHRVVDGAAAARFLEAFAGHLESL